jgi:large subunit ribosomal protein L18
MSDKKVSRFRRARQTRIRIRENNAVRLTVHRTNGHIYAQITSASGDRVLASASTLEKDVRSQLKHGSTRKAAEVVGQRIAEKAFDRAGYRYHGRVKALAEAARAQGLKF